MIAFINAGFRGCVTAPLETARSLLRFPPVPRQSRSAIPVSGALGVQSRKQLLLLAAQCRRNRHDDLLQRPSRTGAGGERCPGVSRRHQRGAHCQVELEYWAGNFSRPHSCWKALLYHFFSDPNPVRKNTIKGEWRYVLWGACAFKLLKKRWLWDLLFLCLCFSSFALMLKFWCIRCKFFFHLFSNKRSQIQQPD